MKTNENKFYCRNCKGLRNHEILFNKSIGKNYTYEGDEEISWNETYKVIECLGCETMTFHKEYGDETMMKYDQYGEDIGFYTSVDIYPPCLEEGIEIEANHFIPSEIQTIYRETLLALKVKALILAAVGFRSIIEAVCNRQGISEKGLFGKINSLESNGFLSTKETDRLHAVTFLGNDAIHEITEPTYQQLLAVLEIINHLLRSLYINEIVLSDKLSALTKDKLSTIIKKDEDFIRLILYKLKNFRIDDTVTIKDLLGKDERRISLSDLNNFENILHKKIKEDKFEYLAFNKIIENQVKSYRIVKLPYNFY